MTWVTSRCMELPLAYLREVGAVPPAAVVVSDGPWSELLADYRDFLVQERGLAVLTVVSYERIARLFLEQQLGQLESLTAAAVSGFLARECPRRSVSGARDLVGRLRPFLRYLHVAGVIETPLVWAVPGVADLRDRSLPRGVEPRVVSRLLASCDRRRTVGRRDYAILLLLIRLGLRAGEVAAMRLEDLDWRAGELVVRGKGDRRDRLPLPVDVGQALVSYLQRRGASELRAVFLPMRAPAGDAHPYRGMQRGSRRMRSRWGTAGRGAPAPAHRGDRDASGGRVAGRDRLGAPPPGDQDHRSVRKGRPDQTLRPLAMPWPGGAS